MQDMPNPVGGSESSEANGVSSVGPAVSSRSGQRRGGPTGRAAEQLARYQFGVAGKGLAVRGGVGVWLAVCLEVRYCMGPSGWCVVQIDLSLMDLGTRRESRPAAW